jgi:hypothetical protein
MRFFISCITPEKVGIMARAESEDGLMVGDMVVDIHPGADFQGLGFDRLTALGLGEHDYDHQIIFLDDNDKATTKEAASQARIIETLDGNRIETWGYIDRRETIKK